MKQRLLNELKRMQLRGYQAIGYDKNKNVWIAFKLGSRSDTIELYNMYDLDCRYLYRIDRILDEKAGG
jgi:hypothetical protein